MVGGTNSDPSRETNLDLSRCMIPFKLVNIRCKVCIGLGSGKGRVTPRQPPIADPGKGLLWRLPIVLSAS